MSNGRDDKTNINFTVADRLALSRIEDKIDEVIRIKDQVIRNTATIKVLKWGIGCVGGSGSLLIALRAFGIF